MIKDLVVVIPARLESQRLPNKPLLEFNGIPMIVHVAKRCSQVVGKENVIVSSPDDEILITCDKYGINVIKSSFDAKTGTDRLVEFANSTTHSRIINVQGDELLLTSDCLMNFINQSKMNQNCTIGIVKIIDQIELTKPSVVKVAVSAGKLIYASRSQVPNDTYTNGNVTFKHTGLYMFTRESLQQFSMQEQGILERTERIEILRFIENRIPVDVVEVDDYFFTIDTVEDVIAAKKLMNSYS